jgi:Mn-containing catalase
MIVYDRLINDSNDPGASDALTLLLRREVARQQTFAAALAAITEILPSRLAGDGALGHLYVEDSSDGGRGSRHPRIQVAPASSEWGFELDGDPLERAPRQEVL